MGLFDKKYCDVCGEKIGLLGNRKLEDGNLCKECAKNLSPWFSDRRRSSVEEIKAQLADREENRGKAAQFRTTRAMGEGWKVLLDEEHRWFTVTRARDLAEANPDILDFDAITGCRLDIDENRTELLREDADGEEVSYVPPRYEYSYEFEIIVSVRHPYFDEMRFRLNGSSVELETTAAQQRPRMGQPQTFRTAGRPDPETCADYRKYRQMGEEICQALEQARSGGREAVPAPRPRGGPPPRSNGRAPQVPRANGPAPPAAVPTPANFANTVVPPAPDDRPAQRRAGEQYNTQAIIRR